jgi:ComF family protein
LSCWRRLCRGLEDVIFPPVCVRCRGLAEGGAYRQLCAHCARLLSFIREPCCCACGHPLPSAPGEPPGCPHCSDPAPAHGGARAAVLLRGPARELLHELKYRGGRHLLGDVEEIFRRSVLVRAHARGAVLVPVPLHPRKRRERGFNQSELIAGALARAVGGNLPVERLLRRIADTPSQTRLDRRARRENLKNAFALCRGARFDPSLRYILVDDVFTTGSTLEGCARILRQAGCLNLGAAAFGHG